MALVALVLRVTLALVAIAAPADQVTAATQVFLATVALVALVLRVTLALVDIQVPREIMVPLW